MDGLVSGVMNCGLEKWCGEGERGGRGKGDGGDGRAR